MPRAVDTQMGGMSPAQRRAIRRAQKEGVAGGGKRAKSERRIVGVDGEGQDTPDGGHIYTYLAAVDEFGSIVSHKSNFEDGLSLEDCVSVLLEIPEDCLCFGFMFSYDVTKIIEQMPEVDRYYLMRPPLREERQCGECKFKWAKKARIVFDGSSVAPESEVVDIVEDDPAAGLLGEACPKCGSPAIRKYNRLVDHRGKKYDYFNGSFEVKHYAPGEKGARRTKIWDCFRFFGCAFVSAIQQWKVGTKDQHERIMKMKALRGGFSDEQPDEIMKYCQEECVLLAQMMRKLIAAHEEAGIPLERFDGAGSTGSALLKANSVGEYKGPRHIQLDPYLGMAVASAFFGGRFEDSVVGLVCEPVQGYDISSAYPFAQYTLPCLVCGEWTFRRDLTEADVRALHADKSKLVLAGFRVKPVRNKVRRNIAWGPLPFRSEKGSISYGTNFSGWAWGPEIVAALDGWPGLVTLRSETWVYDTRCDHRPFGYVPDGYRRRMEWGKEGAGIVMKLGMNAAYGKTAQSIGDDPPFQSWVWAGMTTSRTRAQLLQAICSAKDRWSILAVATDGILSLEYLPIGPPPIPTGTGDLLKDGRPCPLGGWEHKQEAKECTVCGLYFSYNDKACPEHGETLELARRHDSYPRGMYIAKPGLYWQPAASDALLMSPEEQKEHQKQRMKDIRARGLGRREALSNEQMLIDGFLAWNRRDMTHHVAIASRRFYGAKHSIYARAGCVKCDVTWPGVPEQGCPACLEPGTTFKTQLIATSKGTPGYGTWGERDVKIAFDPFPKREREGLSREGTYARLHLRDLEGLRSAPYDVGGAKTTELGEKARLAKEHDLEQADYYAGDGVFR